MPKTTWEHLHILVELLPDCELEPVKGMLLQHLAEPDGARYDPLTAPVEAATPEEIAAIEEYEADRKAGRVETIPHEEVLREFLGDWRAS